MGRVTRFLHTPESPKRSIWVAGVSGEIQAVYADFSALGHFQAVPVLVPR